MCSTFFFLVFFFQHLKGTGFLVFWLIFWRYQLELCKKALEENIIVYLGTGCGKTHIAVLLIYELGHLIRKPQKNRCVFLAPTVALVQQVICTFHDVEYTITAIPFHFHGLNQCIFKICLWRLSFPVLHYMVLTHIRHYFEASQGYRKLNWFQGRGLRWEL